jgi:hypothetical protein
VGRGEAMSRVTRRVWSAGSTRSAGPAQRQGTVRVSDALPEWYRLRLALPSCPCGARKLRCDDCGAWWCNALGHARHQCNGGQQP